MKTVLMLIAVLVSVSFSNNRIETGNAKFYETGKAEYENPELGSVAPETTMQHDKMSNSQIPGIAMNVEYRDYKTGHVNATGIGGTSLNFPEYSKPEA